MAPRRERPRSAGGEKHGWLGVDAYREIHQSALERHPFVVEDRTEFERIEDTAGVSYRLEGDIHCEGAVIIEVSKLYDVRTNARGDEQIRGALYRYTARVPGRGNILRYDNLHQDEPDNFHRHLYHPETWQQSSVTSLGRDQLPTLIEAIEEVMHLAAERGLLDSA